jgi:predicted nucleic acid-binding protein
MTSSAEASRKAVLLDANVLSRLAQIGKADVVPRALANRCTIAPAIYDELEAGVNAGVSYLRAVTVMVQQGHIRVLELEVGDQQFIASVPRKLARGEAEGIAICKRLGLVFITHDRKAANYCERAGVTCLHFSILVEALHKRGLLTDAEAKQALA